MRRLGYGALIAFCSIATIGAASADPSVWREDATRMLRDGKLNLPWANSLGDWVDAKGTPMGAAPFGAAQTEVDKTGKPIAVEIDVTALVRAHGADFRINTVGGLASIASRESPEGQPELHVSRAGHTITLKASADTEMNTTTVRPLGDLPAMGTRYGIYMRFDQPADASITRAVLVLRAIKRYQTAPKFLVFRPAALSAPATVQAGATYEPVRPERLRGDPRTMRMLKPASPVSPPAGGARVLVSVDGAQLKRLPNNRPAGAAMEAWFEGHMATSISDFIRVPGAPTEAFLTVVMKLGDDWTAPGGKLPGFANTGQSVRDLCVVRGEPMLPGGWGGRTANACHWSARTLFRGIRSGETGSGTYFYALSPHDINGVSDYWIQPIPKGRWVAYVEHVKLNDPGRANGEIGYWLVDRASAPRGKVMQAAGGIIWRDTDQPQSAINEVWADVYCGGRDCGAAPWPRSTIFLRRLTVTDGLPDMTAIQRELDAMNARR